MNIDSKFPDEAAQRLKILSLPLLFDSLIIAFHTGKADEAALDMISSAVDLLNIDDGDMIVLAKLAAAVIQKDKKLFDKIVCKKQMPGLSHWIPNEWLQPVAAGKFIKGKHTMNIASGWGGKGEKLFTANRIMNLNDDSNKAPVSGFVLYEPVNKAAVTPTSFNIFIINPFCDTE
jgi:hypothetical protein